jgi:diacylglycerol O-acyltransferase-1
MFRIWAFSGMLIQVPFGYVVARFSAYPQFANVLVWLSIIIGQPLAILMYYHDFIVNLMTTGML